MLAVVRLSAGNIAKQTEKAIAITNDASHNLIWLPKSQITVWADETMDEYNRTYIVAMPVWLAKNKGFWGYNSFGQPICGLFECEAEVSQKFYGMRVQ